MKRFFLNNLQLKIASVVIAVVLWLFVSSKGQTEISLNVPVEYMNIPPGLEIIDRTGKIATLVIRGHESMLKNIRQGDVKVVLDMNKAKKGEVIYPLTKDEVRLLRSLRSISVVTIEPASLKLVFDETVSKRVAVRPVITGIPETGYYVESIDVKPNETVIEGAASEVKKINHVRTEHIDITDLTRNFEEQVKIDPVGRHVRMEVDRVDVVIRIARRSR
jgi:YbbR domain-containing protein